MLNDNNDYSYEDDDTNYTDMMMMMMMTTTTLARFGMMLVRMRLAEVPCLLWECSHN